MGTKIYALYKLAAQKYRLYLHGGSDGLNNFSTWVYLAEDVQNMSFLKGGELIITTGLFVKSGVSLTRFLNALILHGCSGLVINVGKYLSAEDITPEIVSLCDRCGFPLFSMPWETHLLDIMQDFSYLMMRNNQQDDLFSGALGTALHQEPVQDSTVRTLAHFGFPAETQYRVIVIHNMKNAAGFTVRLNASGIKYHLFEHENRWVLVYARTGGQPEAHEIVRMICCCDGVRAGVGDVCESLATIGQGYKRARFALAAALFREREAVFFEEMGLFQVLFSTSDPELLRRLSRRTLGPLQDYDEAHGTEYLPTLRQYLLSDGNMLKTAEAIHVHRNTVVYRMGRIRELLGEGLDDYEEKFNLLVALYIREYFSFQ